VKRRTTLPLGIDVGASRIRIALSEVDAAGKPSLVAVAVRPAASDLGAAICDAIAELKTRERRCVFGIGEPQAILRLATLPKMTRGERERAARFEAARFIDYPIADAIVRVAPINEATGESAIGVVRKTVLADRSAAARRAGLTIVGIDNTGFALRRAFPDSDAVLDVGQDGSVLHLFGRELPIAHYYSTGGQTFTEAVAQSLGIDTETAERRKVTHGLSGAGDYARDSFVEGLASAIIDFRSTGVADVSSIALAGNGARLAHLGDAIERATAIPTRLATFGPEISRTLPPDVLRAAAADWGAAYGLTLWEFAA
jgi:Tfp pilus assembly PilM family ATPase